VDLPARFWPLVGVSLAAHGAVLGYLRASVPDVPPPATMRPEATVFETRVVPAAVPQQVARVEAPAAVAPGTEPAPLPLPEPPLPAQPAAEEPTGSAASAAPQVAEAGAPAPPSLVEEAPYLPRRELTVAPKLLETVDVPFPEDVEGIVDLKVQLTLFIDEDGRVRRIRVDRPQQVQPAFERAIRQTWGEARFAPGELRQVPVRSQIRLEVDFEAKGGRRP
jgi:hypothetical protein